MKYENDVKHNWLCHRLYGVLETNTSLWNSAITILHTKLINPFSRWQSIPCPERRTVCRSLVVFFFSFRQNVPFSTMLIFNILKCLFLTCSKKFSLTALFLFKKKDNQILPAFLTFVPFVSFFLLRILQERLKYCCKLLHAIVSCYKNGILHKFGRYH